MHGPPARRLCIGCFGVANGGKSRRSRGSHRARDCAQTVGLARADARAGPLSRATWTTASGSSPCFLAEAPTFTAQSRRGPAEPPRSTMCPPPPQRRSRIHHRAVMVGGRTATTWDGRALVRDGRGRAPRARPRRTRLRPHQPCPDPLLRLGDAVDGLVAWHANDVIRRDVVPRVARRHDAGRRLDRRTAIQIPGNGSTGGSSVHDPGKGKGKRKRPGYPGLSFPAISVLGYLDSNQEQKNQNLPCCQLHHTPRPRCAIGPRRV